MPENQEGRVPAHIVEKARKLLQEQFPEFANGEVTVRPQEEPEASKRAKAKLAGMGIGEALTAPTPLRKGYVISAKRLVQTEDGFVLPRIVRIVVDEEGRPVKTTQSK